MAPPVVALQWSLAVVLGGGAASVLFRLLHGRARGLPHLALPIAAIELVAAVAFLFPRARLVAGGTLLAVLAAAGLVHGLHGESPPLAYLVFAAAIWTVMRDTGGRHET